MKTFVLLLIVLAAPFTLAVVPGDPGFRGCVMLLPDGQFQDTDCDRVPDVVDNCPLSENPDQSDVDHNVIGDMCDLVVDEIILQPSEPIQGRSMVIQASLFNNRPYPMRNMIVKAELPRLGQVVSQPLPIIAPGQRLQTELLLRVPECAPPVLTDIVVYAEYPVAPGQKEVFSRALRVPVVPSGLCSLDPGQELTVVDIIELQDIHPENGAVYPFTIKNNWPESKAYVLSVQGMESWGTATIEPGSVVVVAPGSSREGVIIVHAYNGQTGRKAFTFSVNAREDAKQVLLQANIPDMGTTSTSQGPQLNQILTGVVVFLGILILIGLVLVFLNKNERKAIHTKLEEIEAKEHKQGKKK